MIADLEVLNEIIPCGIDPVGVFLLETREEREKRNEGAEKDLREVHRLLGALPVRVTELTRVPKEVIKGKVAMQLMSDWESSY